MKLAEANELIVEAHEGPGDLLTVSDITLTRDQFDRLFTPLPDCEAEE